MISRINTKNAVGANLLIYAGGIVDTRKLDISRGKINKEKIWKGRPENKVKTLKENVSRIQTLKNEQVKEIQDANLPLRKNT